jgi:hypothetical protein
MTNTLSLFAAALIASTAMANAQTADSIAVRGETRVASIHAQGAQVYECQATPSGALAWQFREPVATLIEDGKTIGRHYTGPVWELVDGSIAVGKAMGRAPGATPQDIPVLKLEVVRRLGSGRLADVTTIQRLNTNGGVAEGTCPSAGAFLSVPYTADYVFYRKDATMR